MNGNAESHDRRTFFRTAAGKIIEPVADYLAGQTTPSQPILRPPGAVHKSRFNETCQRCGECVKVCPADAIFPLGDAAGEAAGTPTIDPSIAPCVVCEGLKCTHVCPSGALLSVYEPHLIAMGLARVYGSLCVRTEGDSCTACVDRCPYGESAIRLAGSGPPLVVTEGCTGCGVCEFYCPTTPKAITVRPAS